MPHSQASKQSILPNFEESVRALTDAAIGERRGSGTSANVTDHVARFVLEVHAHMPDFLRVSLRWLTLIFDAWPYLTQGRPFHALNQSQRHAHLHAWENSRIDARRSFIAFYKSFIIYGLYAELYGAETPSERSG